MEFIKNLLRKLYAKRTGRTCARCRHNRGGVCMRPYDHYMACWHSITRPGFARKRKKKPAPAPAEFPTPAPLTKEQAYQLAQIKAVLEEAGNTARDGGLVED